MNNEPEYVEITFYNPTDQVLPSDDPRIEVWILTPGTIEAHKAGYDGLKRIEFMRRYNLTPLQYFDAMFPATIPSVFDP